MKNIKKFMALLVVAVMTMMYVMPMSFAAGTRTITITPPTNTASGVTNTYKIYKIFDAVADGDGNISYTLRSGVTAPIMKDANSLSKFDVDTAGNVHYYTRTSTSADWVMQTVSGGTLTADDIAALATYATSANLITTVTSTGTNNAVASNMEDGYYYITTSTGAAVTVDSTTPNATVNDKNSVPSIDKTVQEDSLVTGGGTDGDGVTAYQKQNDVEVGQTVYFKTVVSAKPNGQGYVVYDKMDSALTFSGVDKITVYKDSVAEANKVLTGNSTYNVATSGKYMKGSSAGTATESGDATFILTFADDFLNTITTDTDLIILYEATLNSTAVVNTPYLNDTTLKYGNETSNYSNEAETKTYTWGIDVTKQDGSDSTKLANAKFVIYKEGATAGTVQVAKFDANKKLTGWDTAITATEAQLLAKKVSDFDTSSILTTDNNGKITVSGLDEGTYKLLEVDPPTGYNKMTTIETATIDSTSDTATGQSLTNALSAETNGYKAITVNNNKGAELPSTGGIGTTMFYLIGAILVIGAGVILVTRRRVDGQQQ